MTAPTKRRDASGKFAKKNPDCESEKPRTLIEYLLHKKGVIVSKENPCYVNPKNPDGSCIFKDEPHCDECTEKFSTMYRVVVPSDIMNSQKYEPPCEPKRGCEERE